MANLPPSVLLTGFGSFPGVPRNASADLVKAVVRRARRDLPGYHFASAILPTEWDRVPRLIASLHARHAPRLALHFGVAAGALGFRVETEAKNFCRASPDAAGCVPRSPSLEDDGATVRAVTIAAPSIAATLESKGYPVSLSNDAGGYLCNAALYHSLALAERRGDDCRVGFVHIPTDLMTPPFTLAEAVAGALEIIKFALGPVSASRP
jgi:pyroglutamyl-peptidase